MDAFLVWMIFKVSFDDLLAGLSVFGRAVCLHTELLTSDLVLGQPVTRLHCVNDWPSRHAHSSQTFFALYVCYLQYLSASGYLPGNSFLFLLSSPYGFHDIWIAAASLQGSEGYVNDLFASSFSCTLFSSPLLVCFSRNTQTHTHITRQEQALCIAATACHQGSKVHSIPLGLLCCCRC